MLVGRRTLTAVLMIGLALSGPATESPQAQAAAGGSRSFAPPAAGTEASHWSRVPGLVPRFHGTRQSVSCTSLSHCTAVDDLGNASVFDGRKWTGLRAVDHHLGPLAAVSCPTRSFCAAVGGVREVVEKNGTWGKVHVALANLTSVSCWAASRCRAVGDGGTTMRYDGTWHVGPEAAATDLAVVSCPSADFCMAVAPTGTAYRLHRGRWVATDMALPDITVSGPVASVSTEFVSLDCVSAHLCWAATGLTWVSHWDGTTWKMRQLEPNRLSVSASISCSGPAYCAWMTHGGDFALWRHGWSAVSEYRHVGGGNTHPAPFDCPRTARCLVVGGSTTTTIRPRLRLHRFATQPSRFIDRFVDCPSPGMCLSVDDGFETKVFRHGRWASLPADDVEPGGPISCATTTFCATPGATWNGPTWTRARSWPWADRWSIDCVSPTYCLAAGLYDEGDNPNEVWDGSSWSALPESLESVAVACAAASDCWTMNSYGYARHWDGTSWSGGELLSSTYDGQGLSCPAAGSCLAWNHSGEVVHLRDGVWGDSEQVAPMFDVSCATTTSCVGMLRNRPGLVATYDGDGWTVARALPKGYGGTITDVSCGGPGTCMVVDRQGNAYRRTA